MKFMLGIALLLVIATIVGPIQALYLGTGGVVGQRTPLTGSNFPRGSYSQAAGSRSRDYGVVYGRYRPSNIRPFSSKGK